MKQIYKYPLQIVVSQQLCLHEDFKILSVAEQQGVLCLWTEVDTLNTPQKVKIIVHGTGTIFPPETEEATFIGTVLMSNGLVWHVYYEKE